MKRKQTAPNNTSDNEAAVAERTILEYTAVYPLLESNEDKYTMFITIFSQLLANPPLVAKCHQLLGVIKHELPGIEKGIHGLERARFINNDQATAMIGLLYGLCADPGLGAIHLNVAENGAFIADVNSVKYLSPLEQELFKIMFMESQEMPEVATTDNVAYKDETYIDDETQALINSLTEYTAANQETVVDEDTQAMLDSVEEYNLLYANQRWS